MLRKKFNITLLGLLLASVLIPFVVFAENHDSAEVPVSLQDEYVLGRVLAITDQGIQGTGAAAQPFQMLAIEVLEGSDQGLRITVKHGGDFAILEEQLVTVGEKVVLIKTVQFGEVEYYVFDRYRLPHAAAVGIAFFALVVFVARRRGAGAIIGLGISLAIIAYFIVPSIIAGYNPMLVSISGAGAIAIISIVVAHGWNRRTGIALVSTLLTLLVSVGLALLVVVLTKLSGFGTEEAFYLQVGPLENVNLRGLLLGAIIIGTLGILDDVTTSQVAAVEQISLANAALGRRELYHRGLSVGREHIAALVNTLALAYAGASFPLFLVVAAFPYQPLWVTMNGEIVMEEVIRTLVGSASLVMAVPLSTLLAAYVYRGSDEKHKDATSLH